MKNFILTVSVLLCSICPAYSEWKYEKYLAVRNLSLNQETKAEILRSIQTFGCYAYIDSLRQVTVDFREVLPLYYVGDNGEDRFVNMELVLPEGVVSAIYWCHKSKDGSSKNTVWPFYSCDTKRTGGSMPSPSMMIDVIHKAKELYPDSTLAKHLDSSAYVMHIRTLSNKNGVLTSEIEVFSRQDIMDNGVVNCKPLLADLKVMRGELDRYEFELSLRDEKSNEEETL